LNNLDATSASVYLPLKKAGGEKVKNFDTAISSQVTATPIKDELDHDTTIGCDQVVGEYLSIFQSYILLNFVMMI